MLPRASQGRESCWSHRWLLPQKDSRPSQHPGAAPGQHLIKTLRLLGHVWFCNPTHPWLSAAQGRKSLPIQTTLHCAGVIYPSQEMRTHWGLAGPLCLWTSMKTEFTVSLLSSRNNPFTYLLCVYTYFCTYADVIGAHVCTCMLMWRPGVEVISLSSGHLVFFHLFVWLFFCSWEKVSN